MTIWFEGFTATEAKARFLALLDEVEAGDELEITRHGRLVARIVPARTGAALWGLHEGQVESLATDEELIYGHEWDEEEWLRKWDEL